MVKAGRLRPLTSVVTVVSKVVSSVLQRNEGGKSGVYPQAVAEIIYKLLTVSGFDSRRTDMKLKFVAACNCGCCNNSMIDKLE